MSIAYNGEQIAEIVRERDQLRVRLTEVTTQFECVAKVADNHKAWAEKCEVELTALRTAVQSP